MSHTEAQHAVLPRQTAMIPAARGSRARCRKTSPTVRDGLLQPADVSETTSRPTAVRVYVEPYFVFSKSKHRKSAVDFLRFMTSRKMAGMFARMQDIPTDPRRQRRQPVADMRLTMRSPRPRQLRLDPGEGYPQMFQQYTDMMYETIANDHRRGAVAQKYERSARHAPARALSRSRRGRTRWQAGAFSACWRWGRCTGLANARGVATQRRLADASPPACTHGLGERPALRRARVLLYTLFVIVPSLRSFSWSLHDWNGLTDMAHMPFKGCSTSSGCCWRATASGSR
jgi:hypothetical protein